MDKKKKVLYISLFALDMAITVVLFVISIIMLATMPEAGVKPDPSTFIGYLQTNTTVFLCVCVVPLFILLLLNMYFLFRYVKITQQKKKVKLNDLSEEEKAALRAELLADVNKTEEKSE